MLEETSKEPETPEPLEVQDAPEGLSTPSPEPSFTLTLNAQELFVIFASLKLHLQVLGSQQIVQIGMVNLISRLLSAVQPTVEQIIKETGNAGN